MNAAGLAELLVLRAHMPTVYDPGDPLIHVQVFKRWSEVKYVCRKRKIKLIVAHPW